MSLILWLFCCYFVAVLAAVLPLFRRCYLPLFFGQKTMDFRDLAARA
jgi:hypothetical protein